MKQTKEQLIQELIKERELSLELQRQALKTNLYKFNKFVLGVEEGSGKVPLGVFHKDLCRFIDEDKGKKKLVLVPRGHLKSTLVTVGYSLQRIAYDQTIRILIANATYKMGTAFLGEIKKHLTTNERFIELYGRLADDPIKWSEDMITLRGAEMAHGKKEATVTAFGMGGNLVSQHYDIIILDDIVNRDMVNTREQIEKSIMFYKDVLDLADGEKTEFIVIGTRWHDRDLYEWIMNPENNVIKGFKVRVLRAYDGDLEGESFQALWPEKFNQEYIQSLIRDKGIYEFSCQYLNDPVPDESATFRSDWFQYYEEADIKGLPLNKFIMVDPAISLEKEADFTAIVTVGVDEFSNWYVLDLFRGHVTPSQLIDELFYLDQKWKPIDIGIEDVAFQKTLQYSVQEEMQKRNIFLPVRMIKPQSRSKDQRIRGLQPLYANRKVLHNKDLVYNEYLEDELLRFPRSRNDDMIDALSYAKDFAFKARRDRPDREDSSSSSTYSPYIN